ncbi:hypothetical protein ACGFX4_17535 [Kitasatospora sp. NPDC048365]|uniref:hypothetical protein n=1 Tax=Kitasatospora sp. NPDC048365 TaxID=3364050 RepID=UPI003720B03F
MRRWLLVPLTALLLLLGGPTAHATPRSALTEGPQAQTFGIQPATATDPDGRGSFTYSATPGAIVKDHVALWNYSDQPLTLRLYPADAFNTDTGGYDLLPEGKPSTQAGSWLRTAVATVELPARSRQIVPFTLAVPATAGPGDHPAGIVAVLRQESKDAKGNAVTVDQRVGTRVNVRVAGDLKAELTVVGARVVHHPGLNPFATGRTTVRYTVRNTGNVRLGGKQAVRVTNLFGTVATGDAPADLRELLPGNAVDYRVEVSGAYPTVFGTAGITIDPMAIAGDHDPKLTSTVHKQGYFAIPWTMLALAALIGAVAVLWWTRRRRARRIPPHLLQHTPPAVAVLGAALLALLTAGTLVLGPAPRAAAADAPPAGTLAFDYPSGHDDDAIDLLTSGPCPHPDADYLTVRIGGHGFPAEGAPITGTTAAAAYRPAANGGFVVPLANTLRVIANRAGAGQLNGAYTITASCRGKVNPTSTQDFTGVLTFTTPTTWTATTVAPEGVIHAAGADPAAGQTAKKPQPAATAPAESRTSLGPWIAITGGVLLVGWVALPPLRKRLRRTPETPATAGATEPASGGETGDAGEPATGGADLTAADGAVLAAAGAAPAFGGEAGTATKPASGGGTGAVGVPAARGADLTAADGAVLAAAVAAPASGGEAGTATKPASGGGTGAVGVPAARGADLTAADGAVLAAAVAAPASGGEAVTATTPASGPASGGGVGSGPAEADAAAVVPAGAGSASGGAAGAAVGAAAGGAAVAEVGR